MQTITVVYNGWEAVYSYSMIEIVKTYDVIAIIDNNTDEYIYIK